MVDIAVLRGDGIGPDIVDATSQVVTEACRKAGAPLTLRQLPSGLDAFEQLGSTVPAETLAAVRACRYTILGPVSTHTYPMDDPRYPNPSGLFRKSLQLYSNVRYVDSLGDDSGARGKVDIVFVREGTEGFYADRNVLDGNGELRPTEDLVMSVRVVTRTASAAVARRAFEIAQERLVERGRAKVTIVHKANVLRLGDGLFVRVCEEIGREYPDVEIEDLHVDACGTQLVLDPGSFDVIVTTNMFGDILSNVGAGVVGGLGIVAGLNVGADHVVAQAAHGSAPDVADSHAGNPVAIILSAAHLLHSHAGYSGAAAYGDAADNVMRAVLECMRQRTAVTPDLGGTACTAQFADAITEHL